MSIIGNPILIGGGGALQTTSPLIRVHSLAGATVTVTKDGVTKNPIGSFINNSSYNFCDYYFSVTTGTWTVTATKGNSTATQSVSATQNREYDVDILTGYWIHRVGDGLLNGYSGSWSSGHAGTINSSEISVYIEGAFSCFCLSPAIDLTNYTTCCFEYVKELVGNMESQTYSEAKTGRFGFASNNTTGAYNSTQALTISIRPEPTMTWTQVSIDLTGITTTSYFKFCNWNNGKMGVRNLYLL